MRIASLMTITIALFSLFAAGEPIYAQQSDRQKTSFTINTDLVVTWAQILDRKDGKVVKGLEIDDFALREEGKPQQISLVKEGQPVSVVILVFEGYCEIFPPEYAFWRSREALSQLGEDVEVALMAWREDVVLVQPLTRDWNVIADQLEHRRNFFQALHPTPALRPGEAVYQAARYLEKAASPGQRKVIIAVSPPTTINKLHYHTAAEVKELLERTGATVYGLFQALFGEVSKFQWLNRKDKKRLSGGTIEEFVEQTGGSILIGRPEKSDEMLIKLTGLIRSSYTIGYYPENTDFDGRFRRISLELSPGGKIKAGEVNIKTRNGYRALRPSDPATSEMPRLH